MNFSLDRSPGNLRIFISCLLAWAILITPMAAIGSPRIVNPHRPSSAAESIDHARNAIVPNPKAISSNAVPQPAASPVIAASMTDSLENDDGDGKIDPTNGNPSTTERIVYSTTITNSGTLDANGLQFADTIDPHTTLVAGSVNVSPLAGDDSYDTIGNTLLEVGPVGSPSSQPKVTVGTGGSPKSVFDNDTEFLGDVFALSKLQATTYPGSGTVTAASTHGSVTMDGSGHFSYLPAAGYTGDDTFTYEIKDGGNLTSTGTVTIHVNAQRVWYVQNNSAGTNQGTSQNPFTSLSSAQTNATVAGDIIYVFNGNNTTSNQNSGFTFQANNQRLIGEGVQLDAPVSVNGGPNPTVLRAAGTAAKIGNGAGDAVTVTNKSGIIIRGFVISDSANGIAISYTAAGGGVTISNNSIAGGTGNAIDVTTSGASAGGSAAITNNAITAAGAEGIDVNANGTGTLNLTVDTNTIASTGNGFDVSENAGACNVGFTNNTGINSSAGIGVNIVRVTGTLSVTAFSGNQVSGATSGNGVVFNNAVFDSNPATGATDALTAGTLTIGASGAGNGVGSSGLVLTNTTGTLPLTTLNVFADNGRGINATGVGAATAGLTASSGAVVSATSGAAVSLNGLTVDLQNAVLTSTNSPDNGVAVGLTSAVNGTLSATNASAITNAAGDDFAVGSGTANITWNASLNNSNGGNAVDVTGHSGGTVTFTGAITDTVQGINLQTDTGATINFSGGLTLNGTSAVFNASGGGTVTVTGTNTIGAATAPTTTALNIANTNIGASGVTFQSISATGTSKGIILNTTGTLAGNGGLTVTGTGTTAGSGGTIQNISTRGGEFISTKALSLTNMNFTSANTSDGGTCTDISTAACNAAIYLSSVSGATLDRVNISGTTAQEGINGLNVSDFSLSNSSLANCGSSGGAEEGCVKMRGLTGTSAISSSTLSFPGQDAVEIVNSSGSLLLNVNNSTFSDSQSSTSGGNGLQVRSEGTASTILNVNNSTFSKIRTNGIQATAINSASNDVDVTGCTFDPGPAPGVGIGLDLDADQSGNLKFNVVNNTKIYSRNGPAVNVFGDTNAVINGRINNNADVQVKNNPGGSQVGSGIRANINKDAAAKIEIKNNVVNVASDDAGIDLSGIGKTTANPGGGTNSLDATVTGNNVTIAATSTYGIIILSATNASDTNAICTNVASNSITRNPSSIASFRARVPSASGFFRMNGFNTNAETTWNNNGNTPTSSGGSEVSFGGSGAFGLCTAALPTNPTITPTSMFQLDHTKRVFEVARNESNSNSVALASVTASASLSQPAAIAQSTNADQIKSIADSLRRFTGSIESIVEPTVYAEESSAVRDEQRSNGRSEIKFNHARTNRKVEAGKATRRIRSSSPVPPPPDVNVTIGTLPAGKSVTIVFKVTLNNPPNVSLLSPPRVRNQGTVSGTNFTLVNGVSTSSPNTDDPSVGGAADPTDTPVDLFDTSTALNSSLNPSNQGDQVTFTATVSETPSQASADPSGTVNFIDTSNGNAVVCGNVTLTSGSAQCQTSTLTPGTHNIRADYSGDGNFDPSQSNVVAQVVIACGTNPVVTNTNDSGAGSLRDAITNICSAPNNNITFNIPNADPNHTGGLYTITLTTGELAIAKDLNLTGPNSVTNTDGIIITTNGSSRIFNVNSGKMATISNLNLTGGNGGAGAGGAIVNSGTLTLSGMAIYGNTTTAEGGGIRSDGTLTIVNSTISGNTATGASSDGGALFTALTSTTTIANVTIASNSAARNGGGINAGGTLNTVNTIVSGNSGAGGPDVFGAFASVGHNFIGKSDDSTGFTDGNNGDQAGTIASPKDPLIGALAFNGGPTQTRPLSAASTAVEGGDNCVFDNTCSPTVGVSLTTDQRGSTFPRKACSADANTTQTVDIGAFELHPSIEDIADTSTNEDTVKNVNFNIGDDTGALISTVGATSSNTTLVPNANLILSGSSGSRTLQITPAANESGTTTITITVTATNGRTASDQFVLTVNAVNDPPAGTDNTVTTPEDAACTFAAADFGFFDPNDTPPNTLLAVKITTLPGVGTLTDNDVSVNAGDFISVADINGGLLKFNPAANGNGTPYTTFTFQVQDNGGGTDLDPTPNTMTVNVTATNDAPANIVPGPQTTSEDTAKVFSSGNGNQMSVQDVDAGGSTVQITLTATNGTLTLSTIAGLSFAFSDANGTGAGDGTADPAMTFRGTLTNINTALNGLSFNPTADYNGAASVQIISNDLGNTGTGGALTDNDAVNITVDAANDSPVITTTVGNLTYNENDPATAVDGSVTVTDVDSPTLAGATVSITGNFQSGQDVLSWTDNNAGDNITLSGTSTAQTIVLTGADTPANYQAALRAVKYANSSDNPSTATRVVTFTADDGSAANNTGSAARNITVVAANDAPTVATNNGLTVIPATTGTIGNTRLSISDVDNTAAQLVLTIGTAPAHGTLKKGASSLSGGSTFTQDDINNSLITYTHNGDAATTDSFTFTVSDGAGGTIGTTTFNININCTGSPVVTSTADSGAGTLREAVTNYCTGNTITFNLPAGPQTINLLSELAISRDVTITGPTTQSVTISGQNATRVFDINAGNVTISNLTISGGNAAGANGGGVLNSGGGTATLTGMLFTGNNAVNGGAIASTTGVVNLLNSTISGNTATGNGGGLFNQTGTMTLTNVTVTNNRSDGDNSGGELGGGLFRSSGTVTLKNTIIAGNLRGSTGSMADDISGTIDPAGLNNLIGTGGSGGLTNGVNSNQVGVADAKLAGLADNGGPTLTHALKAGSTALDAGDNTTASNAGLTNDQRGPGFGRTRDAAADADTTQTVDIGAFEADPSVEDITDKSTNEDTALPAFVFKVGDSASAFHSITATSSNTMLVPNANVVIGADTASTRTLSITPAANQNGSTTITVTVTKTIGATPVSMTDTFLVTVSSVLDLPSVTNAATNEDTQSTSGLVITKNANDGSEVNNFKITNITGGTLFKNDGGTVISNNTFITVAEAGAGLKFTPTANSIANGSFQVQASTDNVGTQLSSTTTATITVTPVADTPSVTNATTNEDTQTAAGLVLSRNAVDGAEVTHFKITAITNGTLFTNNGTTQVNNGDFITFAEGNAALKFTPAANLFSPTTNFSFVVQAATNSSGAGLSSGSATATITVNTVPDTPSVTNGTTNEDTQSNSGLVITKNAADGSEVNNFKITNISGGTLFKNDGVTVIANNSFITVAEGAAGLKFTPTANSIANGSFQVQASTDNVGTQLSSTTTATITVTPVADTPSVTNATTNEDTQTAAGLVLSRNAVDGAEVTHFKITAITNGTLFKNNGTTQINNGDFITFAEGNAGLKFTPAANLFSPATNFSFTVQAATSNAGAGLSAGTAQATITVNTVPDTPSITGASTNEDTQSTSGLVITKNAVDGSEVNNFKITNITGGTLFKNDGVTVISNNTFITVAEGAAGLKFTPTANSIANGSFQVQASTDNVGTQLSSAVTATITVTPIADTPSVTNATTSEDIQTTSGLVITKNAADGAEVTHFKITAITNGTLFKNNGTTQINSGDFITVAEGNAGLRFTPTANLNSPANTFSFTVQAATSSSGAGISSSASATIMVNAVNDAPSFTKGADQTVPENSGAQSVSNWATNISSGPSDESSQTLTFQVTGNTNPGLFSVPPAISSNGTLTYTPANNFAGTAQITIVLKDDGGTANGGVDTSTSQTFNINVTAATQLSFSQSNYNVVENAGSVTVTVNRSGDASTPVNVDYATDDFGASNNCAALNTGLASQRCDYTSMFGTFKFAANETQKTLVIPINLDAYTEGPETFTVKLSNPTNGAALVGPATALITISDSASPTPNAIDDTSTFVRQLYRDFLNRDSDPSGLAFWVNNIDKCNDPAQRPAGQTLAQCLEVQRIVTAGAFFLSIEFQQSGGLVHDVYVAGLDRPATANMPSFIEFERDTQAIQAGVIVGQGSWQTTLSNNREAFLRNFVTRPEFVGLYPTTDTPTQYVDKLYQHAAVPPANSGERAAALAEFGAAATAADPGARGRALLRITQNPSFQAREFNRAFVYMEYIGFLRRNPNDLPDNNFNGYDFWVNKLNQFNGDFLKAEMVKAFISSGEYRNRFGQ